LKKIQVSDDYIIYLLGGNEIGKIGGNGHVLGGLEEMKVAEKVP
jgi:hypothetical protein